MALKPEVITQQPLANSSQRKYSSSKPPEDHRTRVKGKREQVMLALVLSDTCSRMSQTADFSVHTFQAAKLECSGPC